MKNAPVCNLAVTALKSRNASRNVALAAEEDAGCLSTHITRIFNKHPVSCLNPPISAIQKILNCFPSARPVIFKRKRFPLGTRTTLESTIVLYGAT